MWCWAVISWWKVFPAAPLTCTHKSQRRKPVQWHFLFPPPAARVTFCHRGRNPGKGFNEVWLLQKPQTRTVRGQDSAEDSIWSLFPVLQKWRLNKGEMSDTLKLKWNTHRPPAQQDSVPNHTHGNKEGLYDQTVECFDFPNRSHDLNPSDPVFHCWRPDWGQKAPETRRK